MFLRLESELFTVFYYVTVIRVGFNRTKSGGLSLSTSFLRSRSGVSLVK